MATGRPMEVGARSEILIVDPYPPMRTLLPLQFKTRGRTVCVVSTLEELSCAMLCMDTRVVRLVVIDAMLEECAGWTPETLNFLPDSLKSHVVGISFRPQFLVEAGQTGFGFLALVDKENWIDYVLQLLEAEESQASVAAH